MMNKKAFYILLFFIVCCLAFIWGNSMLPGEESGQLSKGVLKWLIDHFPFLKWMPEFLLRKLGHFSEFAGTALLLTALFTAAGQRGISRAAFPLLISILVAMADETIQIYSPGRASMVTDVWIDTAGACTGIVVFLIGYAIWYQLHSKGSKQ